MKQVPKLLVTVNSATLGLTPSSKHTLKSTSGLQMKTFIPIEHGYIPSLGGRTHHLGCWKLTSGFTKAFLEHPKWCTNSFHQRYLRPLPPAWVFPGKALGSTRSGAARWESQWLVHIWKFHLQGTITYPTKKQGKRKLIFTNADLVGWHVSSQDRLVSKRVSLWPQFFVCTDPAKVLHLSWAQRHPGWKLIGLGWRCKVVVPRSVKNFGLTAYPPWNQYFASKRMQKTYKNHFWTVRTNHPFSDIFPITSCGDV